MFICLTSEKESVMNSTAKQDLKWLSDLSQGLVKELEEEDRRHAAKAKELHRKMRAMALRIEAEAVARLHKK